MFCVYTEWIELALYSETVNIGLGKSLTQILSPQSDSVNLMSTKISKRETEMQLKFKIFIAYYMCPFFERTITGVQIKMTRSMGQRLHTPVLFYNSLLTFLIVLLTLLYHHL